MYIAKRIPNVLNLSFPWARVNSPIAFYLAYKEIWRYRGRYFLISLVIALITTLVLFIAGLAEGLAAGNKEYIEKLNAEIVLYQANVDLSIPSSRFNRSKLNDVERVPGVAAVGSISFSNASIPLADGRDPLKISLIGVEPGKPGEPPAFEGRTLQGKQEKEAIIDRNVALRTGLKLGDRFSIKSLLGTEEQLYSLRVVGISDGRQYSIQPAVFVPYLTWEEIRPRSSSDNNLSNPIFNIMAVKLQNPGEFDQLVQRLETQVGEIEAVDRQTAYQATPGYGPQQSTLNTQRIFTLLIGVLVVGGFFQIQTLQKVAQVGMLKAIGTTNLVISIAFLLQIIGISIVGVLIGGVGTLLLALSFPPTVPIIFTPSSVVVAILSLLLIGPLGGLVSIRLLVKVEPLAALGLAT